MKKIILNIFLLLIGTLLLPQTVDATVFHENGRYGIRDFRGRVVVPPRYDYINKISLEDLYIVEDRDSYFLMDESGRIISHRYARMTTFNIDGYLEVQKTFLGDYGLIDYYGYPIIPCQYSKLRGLSNNLIIATYQGTDGIIDINNNVIIPFKYDDIEPYDSTLLKVRINGLYGLINYSDQLVLEIGYEDIFDLDDGIIAIKLNGAWGAMMLNRMQIVPVQYKSLVEFYENYIKTTTLNGYHGLFNKQGKQILQDKYSKIQYKEGFFIVKEGKLYGLINSEGNILAQSKYEKIKYEKSQRSFKGKIDGTWYKIDSTPINLDKVQSDYSYRIAQQITAKWKAPYTNVPQKAIVSFQVLRDGQITNAKIVKSSGVPLYDAQALNTIQELKKVEPIPQELIGAGKVYLNLSYKL